MCACQMAVGPLTLVHSLDMSDVDFLALNVNGGSPWEGKSIHSFIQLLNPF